MPSVMIFRPVLSGHLKVLISQSMMRQEEPGWITTDMWLPLVILEVIKWEIGPRL